MWPSWIPNPRLAFAGWPWEWRLIKAGIGGAFLVLFVAFRDDRDGLAVLAQAYAGATVFLYLILVLSAPGGGTLANKVTGLRLSLTLGLFLWLVSQGTTSILAAAWAAAAALLDLVDGPVARRTGKSPVGALFDMESDADSVMVLSLVAYLFAGVPEWVLVPPLLQCLYPIILDVLARSGKVQGGPPVAASGGGRRAKVICFVNVSCLVLALVPFLPEGIRAGLCALGAALVAYSFGADFLAAVDRGAQSA